MNYKLPIKQALETSWNNYKNNIGSIVGSMFIMFASMIAVATIAGLLFFVGYMTSNSSAAVAILGAMLTGIGYLVSVLGASGILLGWFKFILDVNDHKELRFKTLFSFMAGGYRLLLPALIMLGALLMAIFAIIMSLMVSALKSNLLQGNTEVGQLAIGLGTKVFCGFAAVSFILFLYYFFLRMFWFHLILVDRNEGALKAAATSFALTRGFAWRLLGLLFLTVVSVNLVGRIPVVGIVIGVSVLMPLYSLIYTYLYRWRTNLSEQTEGYKD